MDMKDLKNVGLSGKDLARFTGQAPGTISRKLNNQQDLTIGPREAMILACFEVMTDDQRDQARDAFERILKDAGA